MDISVHVSFIPITGPSIPTVISPRNILSPIFTQLRYDLTPQVSPGAPLFFNIFKIHSSIIMKVKVKSLSRV